MVLPRPMARALSLKSERGDAKVHKNTAFKREEKGDALGEMFE